MAAIARGILRLASSLECASESGPSEGIGLFYAQQWSSVNQHQTTGCLSPISVNMTFRTKYDGLVLALAFVLDTSFQIIICYVMARIYTEVLRIYKPHLCK